MTGVLQVAAGVIRRHDGRILIARRHETQHQGGLWEFPGGKIEPDETALQGLRRELFEELGITVEAARPLIAVRHDYGDKQVVLNVFEVMRWSGEAWSREQQPLSWVGEDELRNTAFPAANVPIVRAVSLPAVMLTFDCANLSGADAAGALETGIAAGARMVRLDLAGADETALNAAAVLRNSCAEHGIIVTCRGTPELARAVGGEVLEIDLAQAARAPWQDPGGFRLSGLCQDRADIAYAEQIGAEFALLQTRFPARASEDALEREWQRLAQLADAATMPLYACGEHIVPDCGRARNNGFQGIVLDLSATDDSSSVLASAVAGLASITREV